jgi:DNA-binding transcriptional LysR family regulator
MAAKATTIEAGMTEMADDFADDNGRTSGTVRLVTVETLAHYLIIPQLHALQDRHPDLSLGVAVNASFARLPQREADVGLRLCRPESGNFIVKLVGAFALGLYASAEYLARHPLSETALPIDGHDIIGWSDPLSFVAVPKALRSWTNGSNATLTVDSMAATMLAIKSGRGLGVLPCIVGDAEDQLVRVKPELCHQQESIWLVVHEDIHRTRRIRAVCEFLENIVKDRQAVLAG